jgi:folate-binding protein YgfZ
LDRNEGAVVIEVERVRAGWPANGREIVAGETIPASLGVVPVAVSFTKGCYPGQELVERMDSRGSTAPRTLRIIEDSALGVGDDVVVAGDVVGVVTSAAGGRALAFVDRAIEFGVRVTPRT